MVKILRNRCPDLYEAYWKYVPTGGENGEERKVKMRKEEDKREEKKRKIVLGITDDYHKAHE